MYTNRGWNCKGVWLRINLFDGFKTSFFVIRLSWRDISTVLIWHDLTRSSCLMSLIRLIKSSVHLAWIERQTSPCSLIGLNLLLKSSLTTLNQKLWGMVTLIRNNYKILKNKICRKSLFSVMVYVTRDIQQVVYNYLIQLVLP